MKRALLPLAVTASVCGCSRNPSVLLDHAGPHAEAIGWLFVAFLVVCCAVWLTVMTALIVVLARRRTRGGHMPAPAVVADPDGERRLRLWVGSAVGVTAVILTGFVGMSYTVDRQLIRLDAQNALEIDVTAHQWWWELRYRDGRPSHTFTTANELHVPVGRTVRLKLSSVDVIHSFWLPNLAGKADIVPGRGQDLVFRADKAGVWRGRCSEFCGFQHAAMGLALFVDEPAAFERWLTAQRAPAVQPVTDEERHGRDVFETGPCGLCHVVRGTNAAGHSSSAPDLTHLKSRSTIGAGAAPNSKGHLGGWIIDPHGIKPGVHMPANLQEPDDFQALLAYLEMLR